MYFHIASALVGIGQLPEADKLKVIGFYHSQIHSFELVDVPKRARTKNRGRKHIFEEQISVKMNTVTGWFQPIKMDFYDCVW